MLRLSQHCLGKASIIGKCRNSNLLPIHNKLSVQSSLHARAITRSKILAKSTITPKCLQRKQIFSDEYTKRITNTFLSYRSMSSTSPKKKIGENNLMTLVYGALGGLVITVFGGVSYMTYHVGGTDGLKRTISFYSLGIPGYLRYRYLMWRGESASNEDWDTLDIEMSAKALKKALELNAFYIKIGQMAATNIGNAFPKIWVDTLSVLLDKCPHKPFPVVKALIEEEIQKPIDEIFSYIEEEPIGAASIGQVHRAILNNGDKVVVKVMYSNAENEFRGDVRTLKMFCQAVQPVHVPALDEIEKQFLTEFDYVKEAKQMDEIRQNFIKGGLIKDGDKSRFRIPKPYLDFCTKGVLVMEELNGEKLADGLKRDMEREAARQGKTPEEFMEEQRELDRIAAEEGKLRKGPTAKEFDTYIAILDTKRKTKNLLAKLNNMFVAWWMPGSKYQDYESKDMLPANYAVLIDDIFQAFGHQVLVDGCFNGDPHPGNILLSRNKSQNLQLGLIDYGQVKRISDKDRFLFCKLIIALADDDKKEIVRLIKEAGYKTKAMKEENFYNFAKVSYDFNSPEITGGKHIQLFLEDLEKTDPVKQLPEEFIMISRVSIMLRGLAHILKQDRSMAQQWKPIALEVLQREQKNV